MSDFFNKIEQGERRETIQKEWDRQLYSGLQNTSNIQEVCIKHKGDSFGIERVFGITIDRQVYGFDSKGRLRVSTTTEEMELTVKHRISVETQDYSLLSPEQPIYNDMGKTIGKIIKIIQDKVEIIITDEEEWEIIKNGAYSIHFFIDRIGGNK